MSKTCLPTPHTWPAIAAALLYGLVEWAALSRSRAGDLLHQARQGFRRG
jgi:hypothetical protein